MIWFFVVLAAVVVFLIAALTVGREARRLDAVAPRLAIASVGAGNRYGHPAPETLGALLARGIPALRTDLEGTVVVRSNGEQLTVETHGDHWILPPVSRVRPPVE
ncbi:MAG: hypothetical protein EBS32_11960 [Actinobacteria bacterium]|nr:hypothetical protein [Actinomycetota bacterium]